MSHSDNATIVVGSVGYKPAVTKQPNEKRYYYIDYTNYLNSETTVTSATVTTNPVNGSSPTIGTPTVVTGTIVKVLIEAGLDKYHGVVTCRATFANTEVKEQEFEIFIREIDI